MAPEGQTSTHSPQSLHLSARISCLPSPGMMASSGHTSAQTPQSAQLSLIFFGIVSPRGRTHRALPAQPRAIRPLGHSTYG